MAKRVHGPMSFMSFMSIDVNYKIDNVRGGKVEVISGKASLAFISEKRTTDNEQRYNQAMP
ncbi:hypothetical protein [Endozoicomonas euniceicola]|uniref:Uncharacterized protein n=1 Tax=Endozoicomonas euniceicola TaxID=1234143 RepID=A0ABY6GVD1_9GAMM|nr:hypothetical protein [Endozoicomonas euniceicola]UYM16046.1 hypothetical protein NX720_25115 [Endozoicomonas euniceicola]